MKELIARDAVVGLVPFSVYVLYLHLVAVLESVTTQPASVGVARIVLVSEARPSLLSPPEVGVVQRRVRTHLLHVVSEFFVRWGGACLLYVVNTIVTDDTRMMYVG